MCRWSNPRHDQWRLGLGDDAQGNAQGDGDTLADLQYAEGQVPVRNAEGAWACGDAELVQVMVIPLG